MDIGKRIKAAREDKGWTQQQLARALDVWPNQISRWETGHNPPLYATVVAIARALDAPELLQLEQDPEPEAEVV